MLTQLQRVFGHPGSNIVIAARITHFFQPFERLLNVYFHEVNVHLTALPQIFCPLRLEGRVERLTPMRDERRRASQSDFEVVACIDGRGFGVRRADMRNLLLITEGKVFTLATLNQLIHCTRLREFLPVIPPELQ